MLDVTLVKCLPQLMQVAHLYMYAKVLIKLLGQTLIVRRSSFAGSLPGWQSQTSRDSC